MTGTQQLLDDFGWLAMRAGAGSRYVLPSPAVREMYDTWRACAERREDARWQVDADGLYPVDGLLAMFGAWLSGLAPQLWVMGPEHAGGHGCPECERIYARPA